VPGVVAGTALYMFYLRAEFWLDRDITSTLEGLVAAHVLLTIPWTVRLVTASLQGLDPSVEEAAANLGARPFTVFRRVTLPREPGPHCLDETRVLVVQAERPQATMAHDLFVDVEPVEDLVEETRVATCDLQREHDEGLRILRPRAPDARAGEDAELRPLVPGKVDQRGGEAASKGRDRHPRLPSG